MISKDFCWECERSAAKKDVEVYEQEEASRQVDIEDQTPDVEADNEATTGDDEQRMREAHAAEAAIDAALALASAAKDRAIATARLLEEDTCGPHNRGSRVRTEEARRAAYAAIDPQETAVATSINGLAAILSGLTINGVDPPIDISSDDGEAMNQHGAGTSSEDDLASEAGQAERHGRAWENLCEASQRARSRKGSSLRCRMRWPESRNGSKGCHEDLRNSVALLRECGGVFRHTC